MAVLISLGTEEYHVVMNKINEAYLKEQKFVKVIEHVKMADWARDNLNILFLSDQRGHNSKIKFESYADLVSFLIEFGDLQ